VVWRASVFEDAVGEPAGVLVILRDITRVKRIARNNEAMLRISMALPEYPELYELLDFVSGIIKELMETEGGLVILLDEQRQELFLRGAAYDDSATQQRAKETRFLIDELVAGKVIETGRPIVLNDIPADSKIHNARDKKLGYQTRNLLLVPLKSQERTIGTLCAVNKKEGDFDQADQELLGMLAGTVVLSIENARYSAELKKAYMEVSKLNRAKDKVINHLSHELKTPIAVLRTSLVTLEKRLKSLPEKSWRATVDRARRNIDRLLEMQYQVHDIVQHKTYQTRTMLSHLVAQCAEELEALIAERVGDDSVLEPIRRYIDETYGTNEMVAETIEPRAFVRSRLEYLKPFFAHREIDVILRLNAAPDIFIPQEALQKIFDGLMKNAVENTPDEGRVEIIVKPREDGTLLQVRDFGVGITRENQAQIFEGFFTTRETMDYSSKQPFDFNAGGKGSDLLRIKIFAERYGFKITMNSTRCALLPKDSDTCPGRISACSQCNTGDGCHEKVATIFSLFFPPPAPMR
jgi:signal transduction histidine kinase